MDMEVKPVRAEAVLNALHDAKGGPLNYIGLLDRIGGSKAELDPVLKGLVDAKIIRRDIRGYTLIGAVAERPAEVTGPIGPLEATPIATPRPPPGKRALGAARKHTRNDARRLQMSAREAVTCEYVPEDAVLLMKVGAESVEIPADQMDEIVQWWRRERGQ